MDKETYITLHQAADRLALESARTAVREQEAAKYIATYRSVIEYLISEYEENNPEP